MSEHNEQRDDADPTDEGIAGAEVAGETERFDGLINEPGNPPRQPDLENEQGDRDGESDG